MPFRVDDDNLDPDVYLTQALQAKIEHLNRKIEELLVVGKHLEEVEKLSVARAKFMEIANSPRLYLAKLPGVEQPAAAPTAGPRKSLVPTGAIPQPKRASAASGASSPGAPSAAGSAASAGSPTAPKQQSPSPQKSSGGMMSFLKSVQSTSQPKTQSAEQAPAPQPTQAPAFQAQPAAQPSPAQQVPPTTSFTPSAAKHSISDPSKPKGPMLSFLEKVKTGAASAPSVVEASSAPLPQEFASGPSATDDSPQMSDLLKARAATKGYGDIYEMLSAKRAKMMETMSALMKSTDPKAVQAATLIRSEISEIDALMKEKPAEIARKVKEMDASSSSKSGSDITNELKNLFEELK